MNNVEDLLMQLTNQNQDILSQLKRILRISQIQSNRAEKQLTLDKVMLNFMQFSESILVEVKGISLDLNKQWHRAEKDSEVTRERRNDFLHDTENMFMSMDRHMHLMREEMHQMHENMSAIKGILNAPKS